MSGSLLQILIIVAFLSFSGIGWIVRKLQEQAEIKRQRDLVRQRELERLRTGRGGENEPEARPLSLEERIAEARERRIEELRRRQALEEGRVVIADTRGGTQTLPRSAPGAPGRQLPTSAPRQAPRPIPQRSPTPTPPPSPQPTAASQRDRLLQRQREMLERAQRQQQRSAPQRATPTPPAPRRRPPQPVQAVEGGDRVTLSERTAFPKAGVIARTPVLGAITREDLRRAVVLSEILRPPVGVRPPGAIGHQSPY
ncbi:MAG: hypothetical protein EA378_01155 [Phycisphaerales bacterium]|nr:MAG: hypothetical protein EA378_01155 [Phycisphaerales bacterium]